MEVPVPSLAQWGGLRIQHCCSCGIGHSSGSDSIPGPGISICHSCGRKRRRRRKKKDFSQKWLLLCQESHAWFPFSRNPLPYLFSVRCWSVGTRRPRDTSPSCTEVRGLGVQVCVWGRGGRWRGGSALLSL